MTATRITRATPTHRVLAMTTDDARRLLRAARRWAVLETDPPVTVADRSELDCRLVRPVNTLDPWGASVALRVERLTDTEVWPGALGPYERCLTLTPGGESWEGAPLATDVLIELCRRHPRPVWWGEAPTAPGRHIPSTPLTIRRHAGFVTTPRDTLVTLTA